MKYKILDCTLRDGGYYNLWKFSSAQINEYLNNIYQSKIDIVEIGFRFLKKNSNYGNLAFSKEKFLKKFRFKKKGIEYAVMMNSSDFVSINNDQKILEKKFPNKKKSIISIIRIASHYDHISKIVNSIKFFKKKGYKVAINLMQIHKITPTKLKKMLLVLKKLNIDYFYFADSFGSVRPNHIKNICKTIKSVWKKNFGIHAHDNCGYALSNTLEAYKHGATMLDSTILGMGRGAGNTKTEQLITELNYLKKNKYSSKPVYNLANSFFKKLQGKYKWGASIYYHLAANKNIHPSYIQELLVDDRYKHNQVLDIIDFLAKNKKIYSYDSNLIKKIDNKTKHKIKNLSEDWAKENNVLIVGQGDSIYNNLKKIEIFVKKNKCLVLSLNINKFLKNKFVDYYIASNIKRVSIDQNKYHKLKKIVVPYNHVKNYLQSNNKIEKKIFLNYSLKIEEKKFIINSNNCILPNDNSIGYALALCHFGKAKKIFLAGFDGYDKNDSLQIESENYLKYLSKKSTYKLNFITKNNYKL